MARKGFFGSFFKALVIAVAVFFLLFFFTPETAQKYLGTSYRHDKEKVEKTVQDAVSGALEKAKDVVSEKLSDPELQQKFAALAKQTGSAFVDEVENLVEKAGDLTTEQKAKLQEALSDPKTVDSLKQAASTGGKALEAGIDSLMESVSR
jgi:hypothetical protein